MCLAGIQHLEHSVGSRTGELVTGPTADLQRKHPPELTSARPPEPSPGALAVPGRAPRMLGNAKPNLGPWSYMSSNYMSSTMLEPSMHYLTHRSHSILSAEFCYLCFTGEGTKRRGASPGVLFETQHRQHPLPSHHPHD